MATLPLGINKTLVIARETTFGVQSTATGQLLRRTNETLNLPIDSFVNQEILPSGQYRDLRHGVFRPAGSFSGNMAPGTYTEFIQNLIGQDYTTTTPATSTATITALNITATTGSFTRTAGSFITDGHLVGTLVRFTGWTSGGVPNNNVNYVITQLTALTMTVVGAVTTVGTGQSVTVALAGHLTFRPASGAYDNSFTLQRYFSDAALTETFLGSKISQCSLNIPGSGFVSSTFMMMSQSCVFGTTNNFGAATALSTNSAIDASTGVIELGIAGVPTGIINITGVQLQITQSLQPQAVVGSNVLPYIPRGRLSVTGQLTAYFVDETYMNLFNTATASTLTITMANGAAANANAIQIHLPYIILNSADKTDGDAALFQTVSFQALENASGTAGTVASTILIQDTTA